MEFRLMLALIR